MLLWEPTCRFDCLTKDRYVYRIPITKLMKLLLSWTKEQRDAHSAGKLISVPEGGDLIPNHLVPKFPFMLEVVN
jgi:hypothetical protein